MALIEQIRQMQQDGMKDEQIVQQLKEQGFRPLEINQAIEQSKIKAAISQEEAETEGPLPMQEEMQPSMMETYPQETEMQQQYQTQQEVEEGTPQYIYPTPQAYQQAYGYEEYQPYQQTAETITEISEQVTEEKISRVRNEISSLSGFKTTAERKIKDIDDRLKKIEEMIEKLQASIIGKIGTYGQNMQDIKKEMILMQESFSKTLPSLVKKSEYKQATTKKTKSGKRKSGIEHYLKR